MNPKQSSDLAVGCTILTVVFAVVGGIGFAVLVWNMFQDIVTHLPW